MLPQRSSTALLASYNAHARESHTSHAMCSHRLLRSLLCSSSSSSSFFFFFSSSSSSSFFFSWFFWLALSKKRLHPREAFMQMRSLYVRPVLSSLLYSFFLCHNQKFYGPPANSSHTRTHMHKRSSCHKTSLKTRGQYIFAHSLHFSNS